jgi:hypothetical protein
MVQRYLRIRGLYHDALLFLPHVAQLTRSPRRANTLVKRHPLGRERLTFYATRANNTECIRDESCGSQRLNQKNGSPLSWS